MQWTCLDIESDAVGDLCMIVWDAIVPSARRWRRLPTDVRINHSSVTMCVEMSPWSAGVINHRCLDSGQHFFTLPPTPNLCSVLAYLTDLSYLLKY